MIHRTLDFTQSQRSLQNPSYQARSSDCIIKEGRMDAYAPEIEWVMKRVTAGEKT